MQPAFHVAGIWLCISIRYRLAALFIVDNARPEAILHFMFPVVSGAFFGFWGNWRGILGRDMA